MTCSGGIRDLRQDRPILSPARVAGIAASIIPLFIAAPNILRAQIQMPNIGRVTTPPPEQPQTSKQSRGKNLITLEELNALDVKFHKELDTAQEAFDREKFDDAEKEFGQLATETEDTIKRIAVATLPKGFIEINGVREPATVQTETEWFTRTLDKARRGQDAANILHGVTDTQKRAGDLLSANKYFEARDAYKVSGEALAANRAKLDDSTFQFYSARSENGQKESVVAYWGNEYARLRDRYNRTTEQPTMPPEEIRRTIQSVADEIVSKGYTDSSKYPDMPADARALFQSLLDAARHFLASQ